LLWIGAVIALALAQVSFINQGLKLFDCVLFSPLYSAMLIICGVTFGGIYYQEFTCFETLNWFMYSLGILLTMLGIHGLVRGKTYTSKPEEHTKIQDAELMTAL
jgi:hypothetical protein